MSHLKLRLLGTPTVQYAGQVLTFRTRKALALLIYLAVEEGVQSRDKLAALFWPESDQGKGRAVLRTTLAYLRRSFRSTSSAHEAAEYLLIERDTLSFNLEADVEADWLTLQAAWTAARRPTQFSAFDAAQQPDEQSTLVSLLTQLQTAARLYRGDFLTGFSLEDAPDFDDWASTQRETCHRQMGLVFDRLSQLQAEGGELLDAIETASRWVSLDPLNELAHRRLMQLHFAAEDRSAALQAYEACLAILARELKAEPTPETQSLADRIHAGEQGGRGTEVIAPPHSRTPAPLLPLVGRSNEHLALVTAYRTMRRGQPQVVTLEGEPGIGKTRLAREFLGWALAQGADLLQGRAFEASGRLPYQALIEAVRDRLEQENAPDDLLSDLWLAELSRLLPELHDRYPDLPLPSSDETTAQTRLFEAVTRLSQALAQRAPLILFLDDLQWVDVATLDLLQYASRRWTATDSPVLLLFTVRSEALEPLDQSLPGPGLSDWLMQLQRVMPLTRLTLTSLTLTDIQRLVEALQAENQPFPKAALGNGGAEESRIREDVTPTPPLPGTLARFSQRLFTETGGQPFFLIETLKMLFEPPEISLDETGEAGLDSGWSSSLDFDQVVNHYLQAGDASEIPPSVHDMIGTRLARLSPDAQTACLAAAVLGDNFDFDRLGRVAGLGENEALEALEELIQRGLLREQRQAAARPYVLAHDRFREVAYSQASEPRRRIFHRRAFEALEEVAAPPAELARHALAAGLLERAFELNVLAGEEALRLYAPQTAIDQFTQALQSAEQLAITPPPHLYRARGRAYETIGDFERAQPDFQQALEEAQGQEDRHSEWQALQGLGFLWASRNYEQAGSYFQQALALARTIGEPAILARSLNRVGNWHANVEQPAQALTCHQEALAIFEDLADPAGQAETLDLLGMASFMNGDMQQSLIYYERAVDLFRALDNRRGLVSALAMLSLTIRATYTVEVLPEADVARSVPMAESAVHMAREIDWRAGESHALLSLGQNLAHQGEYASTLAAMQAGLAVATEIEHPLWMTYGHWALGMIHLDLLAGPEAQIYLERALDLARETGSMFWTHISTALLALAHIRQNEPGRAESLLGTVLGSAADQPDSVDWSSQTAMQRLIWYARAELALACQQPYLALQITDRLIGATANLSDERPVPRLSKLRGDALMALGRAEEAEAALRQAQTVATAQHEPPLAWRSHLALSRLYQAERRHAEAEAELNAAQAIIDKLAANISEGALQDHFRRKALLF